MFPKHILESLLTRPKVVSARDAVVPPARIYRCALAERHDDLNIPDKIRRTKLELNTATGPALETAKADFVIYSDPEAAAALQANAYQAVIKNWPAVLAPILALADVVVSELEADMQSAAKDEAALAKKWGVDHQTTRCASQYAPIIATLKQFRAELANGNNLTTRIPPNLQWPLLTELGFDIGV